MQVMGVWDAVQPKIVKGQNIGQTFSMGDPGFPQVGFVATLALEGSGTVPRGSRHDIPQAMFTPLAQDATLLNPGKDKPAARIFMGFPKGDVDKAVAVSLGSGG